MTMLSQLDNHEPGSVQLDRVARLLPISHVQENEQGWYRPSLMAYRVYRKPLSFSKLISSACKPSVSSLIFFQNKGC
jgi:hypothetical protein